MAGRVTSLLWLGQIIEYYVLQYKYSMPVDIHEIQNVISFLQLLMYTSSGHWLDYNAQQALMSV